MGIATGTIVGQVVILAAGSAPGLKVNRVYSKLLCTEVRTVAQTAIDTLDGDPAIALAHGAPIVNIEDAARVRALLDPLV